MIKRWTTAFLKKKFKLVFFSTLSYLLILAYITPNLFKFIQTRQGFFPIDPLLDYIPAHNYSITIFSILYFAIVIAVLFITQQPDILLLGILAYAILTTFRFISILLIPLETPPGIIFLQDPLVDRIFYNQTIITKDLFFSGHTSILFLLFLLVRNVYLKTLLFVACCCVALLLLLQHAHYTIDVVAAPIFAYFAYRLSKISLKRFTNSNI